MLSIDSNLLSYLGGILDGEGSISCCKSSRTRKGQKTPVYSIRISVSMCDKEIPELFFDLFGGSLFTRKREERYSTCYDWVLSCKKSDQFLELILPYIRIKRKLETAKLCLELQKHISTLNIKYKKISNEELEYRENIYIRCKELNHRSKD